MSDITDMIAAAVETNANDFQSKFDDIIGDKVELALSAKYDSMFGASTTDETELELETD